MLKMRASNFLILVTFLLLFNKAFSTHIVGGEIFYDDLGSGNYKICLKIYRDCINGQAALDPQPFITIYDNNNAVVMTLQMPMISQSFVPPSINNPCITTPGGVCVEEGVYETTVNLPPKTGGYYIVYQRCCRNHSILNLNDPGSIGATYFEHIPGPEVAAVNSSPRFNKFPPIFICGGIEIAFDHAATDADGDQLVYSLCSPYNGLDACCPVIPANPPQFATAACPSPPSICPSVATPPPFQNVPFIAPYSGSYPMSSSPAININSSNGFLNGIPNINGQWVVGVCVQEFRAGQLIGTHYRDFQFNVVNCIVQVKAQFNDQTVSIFNSSTTLQNQYCTGKKIFFTNFSIGAHDYFWDFGDQSTLTDTSNVANPSYTYPDTGKYVVTLIANRGEPCSDTTKKTFYVYPELDPLLNAPGPQCITNNNFTFNLAGIFAPYATFKWTFGPNASPSTSTLQVPPNVNYNTPGKYTVVVDVAQALCKKTLIDTIRVFHSPEASFISDSAHYCDPATVTFTSLCQSDFPVSHLWSFSDGTTSSLINPTHVFSPAGVYNVTLSINSSQGCISTTSMVVPGMITVHNNPVAAFSFSPTITTIFDPDIFFTNESTGATSWTYDFGDGVFSSEANPIHTYGTYYNYPVILTVKNEFDCYDIAVDTVKILPEFKFWVPNCFTPGRQDDLNDVFFPVVICAEEYQFYVFDRWGEQLFKSETPGEGWDGKYKGKPCELGTYVWYIKFRNAETRRREEHYGHVTILK